MTTLFDLVKDYFNPKTPSIKSPPKNDTIPPWMKLAILLQGTKEKTGNANNPTILEWAKILDPKTQRAYIADSIPWCGLFVGYCLKRTGLPEDDAPLWARSWANYGIKLNNPAYGCVMVFVREGGGHVGFYISEDNNYYHILGGNQSNSVNTTKIAKNRAIAFRWPKGAEVYLKQGRIKKEFAGKISINEA